MNRRGFTLLELIVVIGLTSVVLGIMAVAMHTMYEAGRVSQSRLAKGQNVWQLSNQFRTDVHAATSVELIVNDEAPSTDGLTLELPNQERIKYIALPGRVDRAVYRDQTVLRRDSFQLLDKTKVSFAASGKQRLAFVTMSTAAPSMKIEEGEPLNHLVVESALGLDHRYYLGPRE